MTARINKSGGTLILPDGTEVPKGATVEISKALAANAGVAEWLAAGWLPQHQAEPVLEPVVEPVVEPVLEPVVEPVLEPVPWPMNAPVASPVKAK